MSEVHINDLDKNIVVRQNKGDVYKLFVKKRYRVTNFILKKKKENMQGEG